jgi:hypothetical protein
MSGRVNWTLGGQSRFGGFYEILDLVKVRVQHVRWALFWVLD